MTSHAKIARRWVEGGKPLKNRNLVMRGDRIFIPARVRYSYDK